MKTGKKAFLYFAHLCLLSGLACAGEPEALPDSHNNAPQRIVVTATRVQPATLPAPAPASAASSPFLMDMPREQAAPARAEASPIVTATRVPTPIENVASPVSVFTGSQPGQSPTAAASSSGSSTTTGEMSTGGASLGNTLTAGNFETRQYRSIQDVMQNVPGLSISPSGGPGSVATVFMRGLKAGNTKLFIDGMPMNDPSDPDGTFNFGMGGLDNISQFEVLRGQHSTLYGSSATGGVISLTSQKGEGQFKGFVSTEAGSRGTIRTRLGSSAGNDKGDFSFAGTVFHTDGISSADKRLDNSEKDSYEYGSYNLRLGANVADNLRLDFFSNAYRGEIELDDDGVDDKYKKNRVERITVRPQATLALFDGLWEQTAGIGYTKTRRKLFNDAPDYDPVRDWGGLTRRKYEGDVLRFDYKSILRLHETNSLLFGVDVERESMETVTPAYGPGTRERVSPDSVTTTGIYIEDQISLCDRFFLNAGMRYTHHETFGDKVTWNTNAMYVLPTKTRIKASTGTGFKAPTLFQLYDPAYGSDDLQPEKTFGWDAGFEQPLFENRLAFGSTFFHNRVTDGIGFHPTTYKTYNAGDYWAYGIESFLSFALTDRLSVSANHTWLRTKTFDDDKPELERRPLNQVNVNVDWQFHKKGTLTAGVRYVGKQWDNDYSQYDDSDNPRRVRMPSYTVVRLGATWRVNDYVEVFGRVENALNKKYQPVYNYGCEPISFYGGATISF